MRKPTADAPPGVDVDDRWLTPKEAAFYLGVTPATLSKWRQQSIGPAWCCALGRDPRYRLSMLAEFMEDAMVQNTRQARSVRLSGKLACA